MMKNTKKYLFAILSIVLLSACLGDLGGGPSEGFLFRIFNQDKEYSDVVITVGGMKNDEFIATESITIPILEFGMRSYFGDPKRWNPNLDLIREIPSDSCYFWIKLSEERDALLRYRIDSKLNEGGVRLDVSKKNKIINDDGYVVINIEESLVRGYILSETN